MGGWSRLSMSEYVCDHARNDQYVYAMPLLKQEHAQSAGLGPSVCATIAQAVNKPIDETSS